MKDKRAQPEDQSSPTNPSHDLSYGIIGSGAVGGYYGGRLAVSGRDVHFLYHTEYEAVRDNGLTVRSTDGDFHCKVNAYPSVQAMPRVDVVIVALKATQNSLLEELLPPLCGPATVAVTLQNGLGNEESIARIIGAEKTIAGTAFICSEREEPGVIGHYAAGGMAIAPFQRPSPELRILIEKIANDFTAAGVKCRSDEHGVKIKWEKLVWNIPFSGLSVYYRGVTTDQILADDEKRDFAVRLMNEVIRAASADGVELSTQFVEKNLASTEKMGAYRPSLLVDWENGRSLEVEAIFGEPLRRAREQGIDVPGLSELYSVLLEMTK